MAEINGNDVGHNAGASEVASESASSNITSDGVSTDITDGAVSSNIPSDDASADIAGKSVSSDITSDSDDVSTDITDDEASTSAADDSNIDSMRIMEALLFASEELLTPAKLKALIPGAPDVRRLRKMCSDINAQLLEEGHPFEIVEAGGGYQFRTLVPYHPYVRKLYKERTDRKLSLQALECLAIIAYRQPISKAEVEAVRGVLSDGAMKTLLEKKLVDICGRSDKPGRPLLYGTTNDFLRYFGINKLSDLPRIEEFESLARAKMEELSSEELSAVKDTSGVDSVDGVDGVDRVDSVDGVG